jgi:hypothetical protein
MDQVTNLMKRTHNGVARVTTYDLKFAEKLLKMSGKGLNRRPVYIELDRDRYNSCRVEPREATTKQPHANCSEGDCVYCEKYRDRYYVYRRRHSYDGVFYGRYMRRRRRSRFGRRRRRYGYRRGYRRGVRDQESGQRQDYIRPQMPSLRDWYRVIGESPLFNEIPMDIFGDVPDSSRSRSINLPNSGSDSENWS